MKENSEIVSSVAKSEDEEKQTWIEFLLDIEYRFVVRSIVVYTFGFIGIYHMLTFKPKLWTYLWST